MPLIVTGTIAVDTVHTPTGKVEGVLGGSCAYFAAAASFYAPVRVVAAVGGNWPDEHRAILERFDNICLDGLEVRPNAKTFAWGGRYLDNMNERETLFTELGVLAEDPPPVPEHFRGSEYVFLANTRPKVQGQLLSHFPDRKLAVADTMDLWINMAHQELLDVLKHVDGLVLNDFEAEQLTEVGNAVTAGRRILEHGPTFVVVKKGEHGAVLLHRDGVATIPAYPAELHQVVDPTGAGDAFAGGMMGHIASARMTDFASIQSALAWGTVTASFAIESFGLDRLVDLRREEIDQRMRDFQAAARVG
ncbi:MAG: PfkB family carbohydrate kinase [Planctomycetota bacterium]|jgi:sugar/nucleoside kinase (ribokinase family)